MNQNNTGALIRKLRLENNLTQKDLASAIGVTEQAVSKWERGLGFPDQSILQSLAEKLGTETGVLLSGRLDSNEKSSGDMKKTRFYICPVCGNILTSSAEASVCCCGKRLTPLEMRKATEEEKLSAELIENEFYISSHHEMTKEHYISFVAVLSGDTLLIRKLYPQWDLHTRLPRIPYATLIFYCTKHGLMYQHLRAR